MAIELYDMGKTWAKIKAGLKGGPFYRKPSPKQTFSYSSGVEEVTKRAMYTDGQTPKSAFGGKTYNERK